MEEARIKEFGPDLDWGLRKHLDCNDDLTIGVFLQSKNIWACAQSKGIPPEITEETGYIYHIQQAVKADFPLSADIPLPGELTASIEWISEVLTTTTKFWEAQRIALKKLVAGAESTQKEWEASRPHEFGGFRQQSQM